MNDSIHSCPQDTSEARDCQLSCLLQRGCNLESRRSDRDRRSQCFPSPPRPIAIAIEEWERSRPNSKILEKLNNIEFPRPQNAPSNSTSSRCYFRNFSLHPQNRLPCRNRSLRTASCCLRRIPQRRGKTSHQSPAESSTPGANPNRILIPIRPSSLANFYFEQSP